IREPLRRLHRIGLEPISWDDALDEAERLLRGAQGRIVTALSGSETIEQAYALGRLLRGGLGAHSAVLPESTSSALNAFRLPLSGIASAEIVVVVGDDEVVDRAPIVDLWLRKARRNGTEVIVYGPTGAAGSLPPGGAAAALHDLTEPGSPLGKRLRTSERAVLIWCGPGGGGGARVAEAAHSLGFDGKPACGAFHLAATPNGRGVAIAWAAAADEDESDPEPIGLLVVVGDDAAASPSVRALAERAEAVIAVTMFQGLAGGWADLVLPATAALERDGTLLNVEGRLQRLRRAVVPPVPDELAWIAKLAGRFDVDVSPHASVLFEEISARCFDGATAADHAELPARTPYEAPPPAQAAPTAVPPRPAGDHFVGELRLVRYRPLFSGPQVERVRELQFQRPEREIELAAADAERRQVVTGDTVVVRSNGTSVELRARINRKLAEGAARIADEHAADLHPTIEVAKP
ncbi:MAG: molybdopterin-dependent oxidoreductase, partial [Gaiellaceae bacterium]